MGHIFVMMGKSATGKDTIYEKLIRNDVLGLRKVVEYTTRPVRSGEVDGDDYHFVDADDMDKYRDSGKLIEERCFESMMVHGTISTWMMEALTFRRTTTCLFQPCLPICLSDNTMAMIRLFLFMLLSMTRRGSTGQSTVRTVRRSLSILKCAEGSLLITRIIPRQILREQG